MGESENQEVRISRKDLESLKQKVQSEDGGNEMINVIKKTVEPCVTLVILTTSISTKIT